LGEGSLRREEGGGGSLSGGGGGALGKPRNWAVRSSCWVRRRVVVSLRVDAAVLGAKVSEGFVRGVVEGGRGVGERGVRVACF